MSHRRFAVACVVQLSAVLFFASLRASAQTAEPVNFLYTNSRPVSSMKALLQRPDIAGVQVVYPWKSLESSKGVYDFSPIERDLAIVEQVHKKLFVQVQDRFFHPEDKLVPDYLLTDPLYGGGVVPQDDNPGEGKPVTSGWVAQEWNPNVRKRYQMLLEALGRRFDGKVYGINLPESAIGVDAKDAQTGFTCDGYFAAELETAQFAKSVFKHSYVVQYVNFWPCEWNDDHKYMSRSFEFAAAHGIGLGGPDIVPFRNAQMENSYRFFHQYKGKLATVGMAVQEATLTYTNPATHKKFTKEEFQSFGRDYLGTTMIFWSTTSPWLSGQ